MNKFGWFITGLGLGTLGGILYAPKAGYETRADFVDNAHEAKEKGAALAKQTADTAGEYVQRGKEAVGQYLEQGKSLADDHLAQAAAALSAGKKAYAQADSENQPAETASGSGSSSPETSS